MDEYDAADALAWSAEEHLKTRLKHYKTLLKAYRLRDARIAERLRHAYETLPVEQAHVIAHELADELERDLSSKQAAEMLFATPEDVK